MKQTTPSSSHPSISGDSTTSAGTGRSDKINAPSVLKIKPYDCDAAYYAYGRFNRKWQLQRMEQWAQPDGQPPRSDDQ